MMQGVATVQSTQRFYLGLAISLALHALVMLNIAPTSYRYTAPTALTVNIEESPAAPAPARHSHAERELETVHPSDATPEVKPAQLDRAAVHGASREESQPPSPAPDQMMGFSAPRDKYFTLAEVDVRARPINEVELVYPRRAYAMRTKGRVLLRLFISEDGDVTDVNVVEAAPPGIFEEAAVAAALALKFSPALRYGQRVKSQKAIEVVFDPYEKINTP